jgi:hypothetical protein
MRKKSAILRINRGRPSASISSTAIAACLAVLLSLASVGISGCYANISGFNQDAQNLAAGMHKRMADGDVAGIYNNADQKYRDAVTREKSDALFSSISRKLGAPMDCTQGNTNLRTSTSGTTIVSTCTTKFSKDATGTETFTWVKSGDQFRLLGYNISSEELIER